MKTETKPVRTDASAIEQALIAGDLSQLTPEQRLSYYKRVCESLGLNPLTKPFEYIRLNGQLVLYARRDAADQLRKLHGISIEIVSQKREGDLYIVHVRARDPEGRVDEELGVVPIGGLKGDALANAILKAITKAKRRVTLSLAGLGWLDETEVETIPESAHVQEENANGHAVVAAASARIDPNVSFRQQLAQRLREIGFSEEDMPRVIRLFRPYPEGEKIDERQAYQVLQLLAELERLAEGDSLRMQAFLQETVEIQPEGALGDTRSLREMWTAWTTAYDEDEEVTS